MSLLAPDVRDLAPLVAPNGMNPELSLALSALGAFASLYVLLNARIRRVELAHALIAARR